MTEWAALLASARARAGLSQQELAALAATSRSTLSAYEHGRKAPTADTMERLLTAAGFCLGVTPRIEWHEVMLGSGRSCWVPNRLWRLSPADALADVVLPLELNWSTPGRTFLIRDRRQRARLYEVVIREGMPADLERWLDGVLLLDAWDELVLPEAIRRAWQPVLVAERGAERIDAAS